MAKIPSGVTRDNSDSLNLTTLENVLTSLSETLKDDKTSLKKIASYQKDLADYQEQLNRLEEEKRKKEDSAKEFNLPRETIQPILKEYEKVIDATNEDLSKVFLNVTKSLSSLTSKKELSTEEQENIKALMEVSDTLKTSKELSSDSFKSKSSSSALQMVRDSSDNISNALLNNAVSMFGLVTKPMEDLLGIDIAKMTSEGFKNIFKKKEPKEEAGEFLSRKVSPRKDDLKKGGIIGASAVYIGGLINSLLGKDKESSGMSESLSGGLLGGGLAGGVGSLLIKGLSAGSIIAGVVWGIVDAISAVFKSDEWGVSKLSAGLAGFFAGSGEGGIKDAFKGMGKWALIGAGIGLLTGPIGALAGGLIGGALGGILGFVGGEKVAKAFDAIGSWFAKTWEVVKEGFVSFISNFGERADNFVKSIGNFIVSIWNNLVDGAIAVKDFFLYTVPQWLAEKIESIKTWTSETFEIVRTAVVNFFIKTKEFFLETVPTWISDKVETVKTWASDVFNSAKDSMVNFFNRIKDFFVVDIPQKTTSIFESIKETFLDLLEIPKNIIKNIFSKIGIDLEDPQFFSNFLTSIKDNVLSIFDKIVESVSNVLSSLNPLNWFKKDKGNEPTFDSSGAPTDVPEKSAPWWKFWAKDVEDALIYKDGSLYRPSPDDHIIATKTPPTIFNKDGQAVVSTFSPTAEARSEIVKEFYEDRERISVVSDDGKYFNNMIDLLASILKVLEDKDMAPIVNDISFPKELNFELMR